MDVNCHNANPVNAEQPSAQALVGRKRGAEGTLGIAEWLAKKPDLMSNKAILEDVERYFSRLGETAGTSETITPDLEVSVAARDDALQNVEPAEAAGPSAKSMSDGLPPNDRVKELVLRSSNTGLEEYFLHALPKLFPKMRVLTIEIEYVWFAHKSDRKLRWTADINYLCDLLEDFLRTSDTIEQIRFDVLDKPCIAVKRFEGFRREADKFVKVVRLGTKTFSASIQASSHNIFGRKFY